MRAALALVVCVAVLAASFALAFAADGALHWLAAVVAVAAAGATLVAAVRLFAALSLLRHPPRR
jgi:O-antigen/teichoic acid export membrane protein